MKIRKISAVCGAILSLSLILAFGGSIESKAAVDENMHVNCKLGANVRKGPSTNDSVIDTLPLNTHVTVLSKKDGWYLVEFDSSTGYIWQDLLTADESVTTTEKASKHNVEVACNSGVNVRSGPGTDYTVIGGLDKGVVITVSNIENNWYPFKFHGKTAYVHMNNFVDTDKPADDLEKGATDPDKDFKATVMKVNCNLGVNIRSKASSDSAIVGGLEKDESINVIGKENNWWKVDYNGQPAYIYQDWLSK